MLSKLEAAEIVSRARFRAGISWEEIANRLGKPPVWTTAALLGQHPMSAEDAAAVGEILDLDHEVVEALQLQPHRGDPDSVVPTDPTLYRFYEALQVYGPALKELIHEKFGDGIMSAIDFDLDLTRQPDPAGDRVKIVMTGKFLKHKKT